ncbi:MAG: hypothetical protein SOW25_07745 [Helicobacter sp.]|nr:hypothetical protein [Helicobacter sp.]
MKEIEATNLYGKGHEQQKKRPYLAIYEDANYFLAFPKTTKSKGGKEYPSHKNLILDNKIEIMIDQLSIIPRINTSIKDLSGWQIKLQQLSCDSTDKKIVFEHFCKFVIMQDKEASQTCQVRFGDIIELKHSNPLLTNKQHFIVLSSGIFHQSRMCCIAPHNQESGNIDYALLHCIDYEARKITKIDNKKCLKKDEIINEIKILFLGNQNV